MIHGVYSIYDRVSGLYAPLFQAVNDGVARRGAVRALGDVPKHDQDSFSLVRMGSFDDQEGALDILDFPAKVELDVPSFSDVKERDFGMSQKGMFDEK